MPSRVLQCFMREVAVIEPSPPTAFARPKSSTLHDAVRRDLDVRRLQIAVDDPLLVATSSASAICRAIVSASRNRQPCGLRVAVDASRLGERHTSTSSRIRNRMPSASSRP